jgi:cbb3-type cytochrome c oxidase subunit III
VADERSWLPLAAVGVIASATIVLLFWAVHRAGAAPTIIHYREVVSESTLRALVHDNALQEQGRQLFLRNCTLCHGIYGQGLVGPNLRDDYWLHGSDIQRIVESIANGNPAKGMAPWKPVLSVTDLHALAVYVASLQGSDDGQGKAAEGVKQPITWR